MAKQSYTAALAAVNSRLDMQNQQLEQVLELLTKQNGIVREHDRNLAQLNQWREDHNAVTHDAITNDVRSLRRRTYALGGASGVLSALSLALSAMLNR